MPWSDMADRMLGVSMRTFRHADSTGVSLVQYIPKTGLPYNIEDAVFDKAHVSVDPGTGVPVSSKNPILGIRVSQLAAEPREGDRVSVGGVIYTVEDYQPDGVAGALLELHKA